MEKIEVGSRWQRGQFVDVVMEVASDGEIGWRAENAPLTANGDGVVAARSNHWCHAAVFLTDRTRIVETPPQPEAPKGKRK